MALSFIPKARKEKFLAKMAGENITLPKAKGHTEELYKAIADNINSGGASPTAIQDAVNNYLDEHPVSGADVPSTDIDFSNWEGEVN